MIPIYRACNGVTGPGGKGVYPDRAAFLTAWESHVKFTLNPGRNEPAKVWLQRRPGYSERNRKKPLGPAMRLVTCTMPLEAVVNVARFSQEMKSCEACRV